METLEQMKKKYDGKPIDWVIKEAKSHREASCNAHEMFMGKLYYLAKTKRYKENPEYKKMDFTQFLKTEFGMSYQDYHNKIKSLLFYKEAVDEIGLVTTSSVVGAFGKKAEEVLENVLKARAKVNKPEKKREHTTNVIKAYRDKEKVVKKPKFELSCIECPKKDKIIAGLMEDNEKLRARVRELEEFIEPIFEMAKKVATG